MTQLSLSEVEAIALKAARGAGLDWGLAEEAAFATRWLVEQGLDGLGVLAAHLERLADAPSPKAVIDITDRNWSSATAAPLCPIAAGAALSDHFDLPEGARQGWIFLLNVSSPALLLPFLAQAADRAGTVRLVEWDGAYYIVGEGALLAAFSRPAFDADIVPRVYIGSPSQRPAAGAPPPHAPIAPTALLRLERLAFRTYVPASDQSRRDAGASGSDAQ